MSVEPYLFAGAVVTPDVWQFWTLDENTRVWATGITGSGDQNNPISWESFIEAYPNAAIIGLAVNAGSGWAGRVTVHFDALSITVDGATTTYDFEPEPADSEPEPATKADCMNGGWQDFGFKNQGQCIRYVNTGHDSR